MPVYAVLADIHANLEALEVVLEDMDTHNVAALWFLGDLLDVGPFPGRVFLKMNPLFQCEESIHLAGNHDLALGYLAGVNGASRFKITVDSLNDFYRSTLQLQSQIVPNNYIAEVCTWPTQQSIDRDSIPKLWFAHGFPDDDPLQSCMIYDREHNLADKSQAIAIQALRDRVAPDSQVWLVGHSHRQLAWWFDGKDWKQLQSGFGHGIQDDPQVHLPPGTSATSLMQAEIDFSHEPEKSLLILNPGSVGFPRDGGFVQNLNYFVAKYLIVYLEGSRFLMDFRAVPYQPNAETLEILKEMYMLGNDNSSESLPVLEPE